MKNYNKRFESIFLMYLDPKNFHGWGMPQKYSVNSFKRVKDLSKFNETLSKLIMRIVIKDIFLK